MKRIKLNRIFIVLALLTALASCHKDQMAPTTGPATPGSLYVLSAGIRGNPIYSDPGLLGSFNRTSFNYVSGSLMSYNFASKKLIADQYSMANGTPISGGTNLYVYGSKMYIISTNTMTVVDAKTSKLIKQVSINNSDTTTGANFSAPVAFYKGNLLLNCPFAGIKVYDTVTFAVTKTIVATGSSMSVANGKLYVVPYSFTGGVVQVIDLATLTLSAPVFSVLPAASAMAADGNGNVYTLSPFDEQVGPVIALGYNGTVTAEVNDNFNGGLTIINSNTNTVSVSQTQEKLQNFTLTAQGNFAYFFNANNQLIAYNSITHTCAAFVTDGTSFIQPTCIAANPTTGEVYVGDAKDLVSNGILYAFDKTGKLEYTLTTGICPAQIVIVNN